MQQYSTLWNKFRDKEFNHEDASKTLNKSNITSIVLSKLRRADWLEIRLNPNDSRKRVYKLKNPEQAVREMQGKA